MCFTFFKSITRGNEIRRMGLHGRHHREFGTCFIKKKNRSNFRDTESCNDEDMKKVVMRDDNIVLVCLLYCLPVL